MRAVAFLLLASPLLSATTYAQDAGRQPALEVSAAPAELAPAPRDAPALAVQQMGSAEPKPCAGGTKKEFTLTISGGLSLGNYEAGMNWALLKTRSSDSYRLTAVTGASAGAINALLSALTWCAADDRSTITRNLFHDVWLPVGFDTMLPRGGYDDGDLLMSRLVSHGGARKVVDDYIEAHTFRNDCGPIEIAVTVTGERPFYENRGDLKAPSNYYFIPITMRIENGKPAFYANYTILDGKDAPSNGLALRARGVALDRDQVFDAVTASSAFPLAFAPVELSYVQRGQAPCPECRMKFSDGGVFDNVPLGLAKALAQCTDENIYFDPDVRRTKVANCKNGDAKPASGPTPIADTVRIYSRALATARNRILFETLRTLSLDKRPTLPSRFAPLTGDLVGAFGAWLERDFRTYDYLAGVYDALVMSARARAAVPDAQPTTSIQPGIDELKIDARHARLLLEFEALESSWAKPSAIKLPAQRASSQPAELNRVAMVRDVMFERHLKQGKQRVERGFCDDELTIEDLVLGLTARNYAFDSERGEFLYAAQTRPDWWWAPLMSRAVRRVSDIEEDHPLQAIGDKAHAVTYPYDPQTIVRFKLGLQARLRLTSNEYQLLPAIARIAGSGSSQARIGPTISVPVHDEEFDPRFGAHIGYDWTQNLAVAWWFQLSGDWGVESNRARVGFGVGVQLVDLMRFGVAYHHGIGEMDEAWRRKWGRREQLAFIIGMNLETAWGIAF